MFDIKNELFLIAEAEYLKDILRSGRDLRTTELCLLKILKRWGTTGGLENNNRKVLQDFKNIMPDDPYCILAVDIVDLI